VLVDPIATGTLASPGTYFWMGGQGTVFWVDPKEELIVVAMMQISPPLLPRLRGELEALIYQAIID
jgi:CubicO group peptidase (beta-lactamase class C family)